MQKSKLSKLGIKYEFDLIPICRASTSAGYDDDTRKLARIGAEPLIDNNVFYYTAWYQDEYNNIFLNSMLVCRKIDDGSLVYAVSCGNFNLDMDPNALDTKSVICKDKIAIHQSRLYLCNSILSNIGPQLYCIDKHTGALCWAAAYDSPRIDPEWRIITKKGNYAHLYDGHLKYCNSNPKVFRYFNRTFIAVATSSKQHMYPIDNDCCPTYRDVGALILLEDHGKECLSIWKLNACPAPFKKGMILDVNDSEYNIFDEEEFNVSFSRSEEDYPINKPHFFGLPPIPGNPGTTPIIILLRDLENIPEEFAYYDLYLDSNREKIIDREEIIEKFNDGALHAVWCYLRPEEVEEIAHIPGLIYLREYDIGDRINTHFEAQNLNYYGNNIEGDSITVDTANNMIYFATGHGHSSPFYDCLYHDDNNNYYDIISPLLDSALKVSNNNMSLKTYNKIYKSGCAKWNRICHQWDYMSPRSKYNYSSSILGVSILKCREKKIELGAIRFVVRTTPFDSDSFANSSNIANIFPFRNLATSIITNLVRYGSYLIAVTNSGFLCRIAIPTLNPLAFEANSKAPSNISYDIRIISPVSAINSNQITLVDNMLYITCTNMTWNKGAQDQDGNLHPYISTDGETFPNNCSFILVYNIDTDSIISEIPIYNRCLAGPLVVKNKILVADVYGTIHGLDPDHGRFDYKINGSRYGVNGGNISPLYHKDSKTFLYLNNAPTHRIMGNPGSSGICLAKMDNLKFIKLKQFYNRGFRAWHIDPKEEGENGEENPENRFEIIHIWNQHGLTATHDGINYSIIVKKLDKSKSRIKLKNVDNVQDINRNNSSLKVDNYLDVVYDKIIILNNQTYYAILTIGSKIYKAWFSPQYNFSSI